MFKKREPEDYLSEESYLKLREQRDMEEFETKFKDFHNSISYIKLMLLKSIH